MRALTRVAVSVRRRVSHAVSNQGLLALNDISLNATVVEAPLPEDVYTRERESRIVAMYAGQSCTWENKHADTWSSADV